MEISVILSVYHKETPLYLEKALGSLFNQTLKAKEVILIEDGPLGNELQKTIERFERTYSELKVIKLEKNCGLAHALNVAIKECKTDYIARMDTDDISDPVRFERQSIFLSDHPEVDCVGTWVVEIRSDDTEFYRKKMPLTHEECRDFYMKRNPMAHPTVMFRKRYFDKAGLYPEDTFQEEDTMLWANGFANGCIFANIPEFLYRFRIDENFFNRRKGLRFAKDTFMIRHKVNKMLGFSLKADFYALLFACSKMMPEYLLKMLYKFAR